MKMNIEMSQQHGSPGSKRSRLLKCAAAQNIRSGKMNAHACIAFDSSGALAVVGVAKHLLVVDLKCAYFHSTELILQILHSTRCTKFV